jgi:predicted nucleic acid-binding protein
LYCAQAFRRLRGEGVADSLIADAAREADAVWARCTIWEISPAVCELAAHVGPHLPLRTLDALHLTTFLVAPRRLGGGVTLLTADERLQRAAAAI